MAARPREEARVNYQSRKVIVRTILAAAVLTFDAADAQSDVLSRFFFARG